jgi:hypothetical protein
MCREPAVRRQRRTQEQLAPAGADRRCHDAVGAIACGNQREPSLSSDRLLVLSFFNRENRTSVSRPVRGPGTDLRVGNQRSRLGARFVCWRRFGTGPFRRLSLRLVHWPTRKRVRECSRASRLDLAPRGGYAGLCARSALPCPCLYVGQSLAAEMDQFQTGFASSFAITLSSAFAAS